MFSMPRISFVSAVISAMVGLVLAFPAFASADFPLTITPAGSGTGTVECEVGAGPAEPCAAEYAEGTELSLVAEADPGSEFVEFSGDCGPAECELTMNEAHAVTVTFDEEEPEVFPLTVETAGSGTGTVECEVGAGPAEPCEAEYAEGTELTLIAEADPGSEFVEWVGDCGPAECELTMNGEREAIAIFELEPEEFALTITPAGTGTGTVECEAQEGPEACQAEYPEGTELTLIPVAGENSEFVEFSGDCGPAECELTMNEAHAVTATFDAKAGTEFELTITKAGTGEGEVECKVNGGAAEPCAAKYETGTELSLVATAESGSTFAGYSAGSGSASACSTSPCTFTINADSAVTATFNESPPEEFTLTITKAGTGTGEVECKVNGGAAEPCAAKYETGTELSLVAEAGANSTFAGYSAGSGSASACSTSPCTFTITANSAVTATFNLVQRTLTITKAGTGTGDVKCKVNGGSAEACAASYAHGTELSLVATAESGSTFAGYSAGSGSASACSTSPCTFTITANSAVTATFTAESPPEEFSLTVAKAGSGSGTVTCNGGACAATYAKGSVVTLAASAASGSTFAGWSGGGCSGTGTCVVTLNGNTTVTATFNLSPTPPPPPVGEGKVKVGGTALVRAGKAALKLTCSGGPCAGKLKLKAKVKQGGKTKNLVIGKASFSLADGTSRTLKVKLSAPARQELEKRKTLRASVSGTGVVSSKVKLKAKK